MLWHWFLIDVDDVIGVDFDIEGDEALFEDDEDEEMEEDLDQEVKLDFVDLKKLGSEYQTSLICKTKLLDIHISRHLLFEVHLFALGLVD